MLLSMGLQRVGHDLVTEQQQKYLQWQKLKKKNSVDVYNSKMGWTERMNQ